MAQESNTYREPSAEPVGWQGTARYEVLSCLGKGGMGVVYEVFDRERQQVVALKTLLRFGPAALYLFKQEFRTLADVQHASLVHLYELVVPEVGQVFFTMELVRGTDFRRYVQKRSIQPTSNPPPTTIISSKTGISQRDTVRPRAPGEAAHDARISRPLPADLGRLRPALRQLVEGIHALHSAGKLHRDIKPSNVLVTAEGRVVLLDFGVATELSGHVGDARGGSGELVGTVRYMAPEQADDEPPTPASDWYSVGVMLYEALVGRTPFVGSVIDVLTIKSAIDAPPPSEFVDGVPPDLDALCRALLHRDPTMRPAGEEILRRLGVTRSTTTPPPAMGAVDTATAFIGREAQLRTLREAFEAARSGRSVTVRVAGASGMGKSTVAHHLLDELVGAGEALVLRGRAYERESVPYKAVDSAIDALSRHLMRLADDEDPLPLPEDVWALGHLFPVLQRIPGVNRPEQSIDDPQGLRRRAFRALRELLASLAERRPLVLFVDDAQWGDVDSALLLLELLRPPGAPAVLLLMTYRDNEEQTSPFLTELRNHWPDGAELRDVSVGPLDLQNAQRLASTLLGASDEMAHRTAKAVARESGGSPFLIEELVRSNRGTAARADGPTLGVHTLGQMVSERLERLPEQARRLIEIVAVGGRPLAVSIVADASGEQDPIDEVITLLSARRFARTGLRGGCEVVETSHDRIRETIVEQLTPATVREHHGRLARVLEKAPGVDAEAIAMHWLGAGDNVRAAGFAESAGEQAAAKFAFDQAARLFRLTLENLPASPADARRLRIRLAQVLELAGRATESARIYLELVEGAPATQKVEYQRAAAEQLLSAGRIDEGAEILHRVLTAVGMSAPRSPLSALFWLIVYRIWLALLGLRFKERRPEDVRPEDRLRVDALWTVSTGFGIVNIILGACMQARHFIEAFRKGDRFQVMRAASAQAAHIAATGKPETERERALLQIGRTLAERDGSALARTYVEGAWGIGLFMRGLWRQANATLQPRDAAALANRSNAAQVRLFLARTYYFMGDPKECAKREARLYTEAEDRGDLYTTVNMRTSTHVWKWLAADEPERARREVREAIAQWPHTGFLVQHWQAMVYTPTIDLYVGDVAAAYDRFARDLPALKRSLLLHAGFIRAVTFYTQGRLAIASIESRPELRHARIAEARRMSRRLQREYNPWTAMLAALVEATADNAAGDRPAAIAALRRAIEWAESTESGLYAPAARYRLGELLGGDDGRALMQTALRTLTEWGVRNPERWLWVYMPGSWGPDARPS